MVHLLKSGIAWDAIMQMSEQETYFVLGVSSALTQREQDAEAKAAAPTLGGLRNL